MVDAGYFQCVKPSVFARGCKVRRLTVPTGLELEVFASLGLYPTYVVMQGFSNSTGVLMLAIINMYDHHISGMHISHTNGAYRFSTLGRLLAGGIADNYGRINTQSGLICLGVFAIFAIWLPFGNTLAGLYVFSCVFGLASGSFLSLAPACIGQISKASEVGGRFGICYSMVSLAYVFLPSPSIRFSSDADYV